MTNGKGSYDIQIFADYNVYRIRSSSHHLPVEIINRTCFSALRHNYYVKLLIFFFIFFVFFFFSVITRHYCQFRHQTTFRGRLLFLLLELYRNICLVIFLILFIYCRAFNLLYFFFFVFFGLFFSAVTRHYCQFRHPTTFRGRLLLLALGL